MTWTRKWKLVGSGGLYIRGRSFDAYFGPQSGARLCHLFGYGIFEEHNLMRFNHRTTLLIVILDSHLCAWGLFFECGVTSTGMKRVTQMWVG